MMMMMMMVGVDVYWWGSGWLEATFVIEENGMRGMMRAGKNARGGIEGWVDGLCDVWEERFCCL